MNRVLVIDDDKDLCELLSDYLSGEGFTVMTVNQGDRGALQARSGQYALIILDVMLPGQNGFDVLRNIRETSKVPVIMLTARGEDIDRIVGLELGADDYLPKPFNPRELVARMRAILRRSEFGADRAAIVRPQTAERLVGDILLCPADRSVKRQGEIIELTSVEFTLLEILLAQAGTVVSREELVEKALGRRLSPYDRSIDVHVSALRRKLGHHYQQTERIKTVRGVGYLYTQPPVGNSTPQGDSER